MLSTPDGDGLAGLAFPLPISGNGVLLATLSFKALSGGAAVFTPSYTPTDLTEGFPLASSGFADIVFNYATVTVNGAAGANSVPEPPTVFLLVAGLFALVGVNLRKDRGGRRNDSWAYRA